MKVTKQAKREAKQLFRRCLKDGAFDENRIRQMVQYLMSNKPRGYLAIVAHLKRLAELEIERRAAKVESAIALTPEFQIAVKENLKRIYGPGLSFTFEQKPDLIGGLRIQVGSDVYDGSVRTRLTRLQESF